MRSHRPRPLTQRGAALIESLVSMLIVAFGVLGFVGLQARTAVSTLEGYQRAQALVLLEDMAARLTLNRKGLRHDYYLREGIGATSTCTASAAPTAGGGTSFDQVAFDTANTDLCAWADLIRGMAERDAAGNSLGAVTGAFGCVTRVAPQEYLVTLAWQGIQASGASALACGRGAYPSENLRRGASLVVRIGTLS